MWHTIKLDVKKDNTSYHCHITQKLSKHNIGHYRGFITDDDGHCVAVVESTGSPKDPLRLEEATEICQRAIPDSGDFQITRRTASLEVPIEHPQTTLEHKLPE
jgi:hypothetical protein